MLFESLDYLYTPSRDVAADVRYFTEVLGARLVFAIDAMGTRVAMVELADGPPQIVLAGHLEGDQPILVYRVADLDAAARRSSRAGAGRPATAWRSRRVRCGPSRPRAASAWRSTSSIRPGRDRDRSPAGASSERRLRAVVDRRDGRVRQRQREAELGATPVSRGRPHPSSEARPPRAGWPRARGPHRRRAPARPAPDRTGGTGRRRRCRPARARGRGRTPRPRRRGPRRRPRRHPARRTSRRCSAGSRSRSG